ncbi:MAG: helix-turn-helix domain-containing protein [Jatrophihabitantaceae bacterium]
MSQTPMKAMRRDAAQNRQRLIDAAGEAFAEHGLHVAVEQIAQQADVGMGTLYRHFPTKQALIDELVGAIRRQLLALAEQAAERPDGQGLAALMYAAGELQAARSGCLAQLWNTSQAELSAVTEFRRIVAEQLALAKQHGLARDEITPTDISLAMWSLRGVIEMTHSGAPLAWRRYLEVHIAGLRPVDQALTERPLSEARYRRIVLTGRRSPSGVPPAARSS